NSLGQTTADAGGAFSFTGIALALGANSFTARATDTAGNVAEFNRTITRVAVGVDADAPVITAALVNDTGTDAHDGITQDASVSGTVTDVSAIVSFKAGFDTTPVGSFVDILTKLGAGGQFALSAADLNAIAGGVLA